MAVKGWRQALHGWRFEVGSQSATLHRRIKGEKVRASLMEVEGSIAEDLFTLRNVLDRCQELG